MSEQLSFLRNSGTDVVVVTSLDTRLIEGQKKGVKDVIWFMPVVDT